MTSLDILAPEIFDCEKHLEAFVNQSVAKVTII